MSAPKHTPAPWSFEFFAAAPDMYEALKRQCDNIERWRETGVAASPDESESIYEQIVAALAKAEGRTPTTSPSPSG